MLFYFRSWLEGREAVGKRREGGLGSVQTLSGQQASKQEEREAKHKGRNIGR